MPETYQPNHHRACEDVVDYEALACELIRELRGEHSQRRLSQLLGYSFNQVGKWESGSKQISWNDFAEVMEVTGRNLESNLRYFFEESDNLTQARPLISLLYEIFALDKVQDPYLQRYLKAWISGAKLPLFSDFLRILDQQTSMLVAWIHSLWDPDQLPALKGRFDAYQKRIELTIRYPEVIYVNAALQLEGYKRLPSHCDAYLAEHAACSEERVRFSIQVMLNSGIIGFNGKKYFNRGNDFSFSSVRNPKIKTFTQYTTQLAANKYPLEGDTVDWSKITNESVGSARVNPLSKEASEKIAVLVRKFHSEVGEIYKNDRGPKEHVQVILIQSFASNIEKS